MAIEKTGFQAQETASLRQFPRRLVTTGEESQICVPDGYAPGEGRGSSDIPDDSRALWSSRERGEESSSPPTSFLRKLGISIALGITGLAILPAAFTVSHAGVQPPSRQPAMERIVTTEGEGAQVCVPDVTMEGDSTRSLWESRDKGAAGDSQQPVAERYVEGPDLQPFRDAAFEMTAQDVIKEIAQTAQDLQGLDDSPGQFPAAQNETGGADSLRGKGQVSVTTPQVITRSRSVSGTMRYDTATGEPISISAEVMTRIGGTRVGKHVEYSQNDTSKTLSVSLEGITYRITTGRNSSIHETFRQLSARDVMTEVNNATVDLRRLDDSPEQQLIEQNGTQVPGGSIDRSPAPGDVRIVSPHKLSDGRTISGAYSYDGDTGRPKGMRAVVSENSGRYRKTRTVELSEGETVRTYRVKAGGITFDVLMEKLEES